MGDQVKGFFFFFFVITESFLDLNLVALSLVTAVGCIGIRRILKRVRSNFFGFLKLNRIVLIIGKIAVLFQNPFKQFVTYMAATSELPLNCCTRSNRSLLTSARVFLDSDGLTLEKHPRSFLERYLWTTFSSMVSSWS